MIESKLGNCSLTTEPSLEPNPNKLAGSIGGAVGGGLFLIAVVAICIASTSAPRKILGPTSTTQALYGVAQSRATAAPYTNPTVTTAGAGPVYEEIPDGSGGGGGCNNNKARAPFQNADGVIYSTYDHSPGAGAAVLDDAYDMPDGYSTYGHSTGAGAAVLDDCNDAYDMPDGYSTYGHDAAGSTDNSPGECRTALVALGSIHDHVGLPANLLSDEPVNHTDERDGPVSRTASDTYVSQSNAPEEEILEPSSLEGFWPAAILSSSRANPQSPARPGRTPNKQQQQPPPLHTKRSRTDGHLLPEITTTNDNDAQRAKQNCATATPTTIGIRHPSLWGGAEVRHFITKDRKLPEGVLLQLQSWSVPVVYPPDRMTPPPHLSDGTQLVYADMQCYDILLIQ